MYREAIDVQAGNTILVEYGEPDNFVPFRIKAVYATESRIVLTAESKVGNETFVFRPEEKLLVMPNG